MAQKKEAKEMPMVEKNDLEDQLARIDADLAALVTQEAAADQGIDHTALQALRGDATARLKLSEHEVAKNATQSLRRHLEAARRGIKTELENVAAAQKLEAERKHTAEIKKRMMALKERAAEVDAAAKVLVQSFEKFRSEATSTGLPRLHQELVDSHSRRALASHLRPAGLSLDRLAPAERKTFSQIVQAWMIGIPV
jgi:hypothetical protein